MIEIIISGGQTGADRGGLDAAIQLGVPHGGWCPLGRRAHDGRIPEKYQLTEVASRSYSPRTRKNVVDADATIVFTYESPGPGSAYTIRTARSLRKPYLVVLLEYVPEDRDGIISAIRAWLDTNPRISILNVAGSGIAEGEDWVAPAVCGILVEALEGRVASR